MLGNLIEALREQGVDAGKIEFVSAEETEVKRYLALEMLERGEVDAAQVDIPFDLVGQKRGFSVLPVPERPVIHNTTICASTEFVRRNEQKTLAFLKAVIEAVWFFKNRPDAVCEIRARRRAAAPHTAG